MTNTFYVPGTEEQDLKKVIMSLQQIAGYLTTHQTEGSWTPTFAFATPGDYAGTLSTAAGYYIKTGRQVATWFNLTFSAFSHTTASGAVSIGGLPVAPATGLVGSGSGMRGGLLNFSGVTKAGYTVGIPVTDASGGSFFNLNFSGSGVAQSQLAAADMPTGGTPILRGMLVYVSAS